MYLIGLTQFYPIRKIEDIKEKEVKLWFHKFSFPQNI
jgi:hypothetical protein